LEDHGVEIEAMLTQYYQGCASGGAEQTFRYGAKFDLLFDFDTERLGLWRGGKVRCHAVEWQFGQNSIADAEPLAPVNLDQLAPTPEASFGLTYLMLEHIGEQRLWQDPCDEKRYSKLWGYVGLADPKTSPFEVTGAVTLEGLGYFDRRPDDRMGIGYFYTGLSGGFRNLLNVVEPSGDVHGRFDRTIRQSWWACAESSTSELCHRALHADRWRRRRFGLLH
jgi:carbohydrate-selective porin OprB